MTSRRKSEEIYAQVFLRLSFSLMQNIGQPHLRQYPPNPAMVMRSIINMNNPNGMMSRNQLTTINQSQLNAQLGMNMTGPNIAHTSPSPPASKSATPSPSSSINEDEGDESNRVSDGSSLYSWLSHSTTESPNKWQYSFKYTHTYFITIFLKRFLAALNGYLTTLILCQWYFKAHGKGQHRLCYKLGCQSQRTLKWSCFWDDVAQTNHACTSRVNMMGNIHVLDSMCLGSH